jgi:hypothetical protein
MWETPEGLSAKPAGRGLGPIPRSTARLAEALRIGLASIALLLVLGGAARAAKCDYYASPTGTGNGLSASSPFKVSKFWTVASAGKTLCLMDGTYTGSNSMILPPWGLGGASGLPITIRAANDGKVLITGQGSSRPVRLVDSDWFVIEGINACCSSDTVVELEHSNHNVVRRVAAWDAADNNTNVFGAHSDSSYNLFEDVAGWGTARKIFSMSQDGNYITIRRAWGRWERSTVVGPKMTYTLAYNNYHTTCENCLGTWSGQGMPESYILMDYDGQPFLPLRPYTNYAVDQPYGIFSADREDGDKDAYARLLGSLAYILATDTYKPNKVVWMHDMDSIEIKDTAVYIAPGTNPSPYPFGLNGHSANSGPQNNLHASDLTAFGGAASYFEKEWIQSNLWSGSSPAAYSPGENIFNTSRGANLCYQYRNGSLTSQKLWPWPMNQRIKDALVQSGRASVDITATIQSLFGTIPEPCRASFDDVPLSDPFSPFIQTLYRLGITAGCGGGNFCPDVMVTNGQMAVFLLRSRFGTAYVPPPATGEIFADVRPGDFAANWIEALYNEGFTEGCGSNPLRYCPDAVITREQMAKLLLLAKYGGSWSPPPATDIFQDVLRADLNAPWIEQLALLGVTGGCQTNPPLYCPTAPITRGQMAVFLVKTFGLK